MMFVLVLLIPHPPVPPVPPAHTLAQPTPFPPSPIYAALLSPIAHKTMTSFWSYRYTRPRKSHKLSGREWFRAFPRQFFPLPLSAFSNNRHPLPQATGSQPGPMPPPSLSKHDSTR
eukprot:1430429-Pyramimonas_sp.AAC.1